MQHSTTARLRLLVNSSQSTIDDITVTAHDFGATTLTTDRLNQLIVGSALPTLAELDALAHALGVTVEHFTSTDAGTVAITEATAVLAAAARRQDLRIIGPCRHRYPARPVDYIALLGSLLSATASR